MSLYKDGVPWKVVEWAMRKKGIPLALVTAVMSLYKDGVLWNVVEWAMRKKGIPVALVTAVMSLYKDGVPWKVVEWAMRKKGIPVALVTAVMSLYKDGVPWKVVEWAMRKKGIPVALVTAVMSLYKDGVPWKVVEWAMRNKGIPVALVTAVMSLYKDGVPWKVVEWAMRKKGIPVALVTAVMSLYNGSNIKVKVGTHLSDEFEVDVGVHQGTVLSPLFLFAIVVDAVTNELIEGMLQEILYADDIVLMAESMAELQETFYVWKSALESKGLNLMKTLIMVSKPDTQSHLNHLSQRPPNKVLQDQTPSVSPAELLLSRETRRTLAQLRTNKSPLLVSYLFSIGDPRHPSPLCPLCLMHDHTSSHLFECKSLPTSLSSLDLWMNPDKVEPFLATWGERLLAAT